MAELQGTCASLSEEEIAKLSVHLLNCQSAVEGRQTFRCTSDMVGFSLKYNWEISFVPTYKIDLTDFCLFMQRNLIK